MFARSDFSSVHNKTARLSVAECCASNHREAAGDSAVFTGAFAARSPPH